MYEIIKNKIVHAVTIRRVVYGAIGILLVYLIGSLASGYFETRADYKRTFEQLERAQEQQRESLELNRSIQHSIDRSADLSREAGARIERSAQYNQQIGGRISQSQGNLSEARSYLERNAEIIRRVEEQNRAGQPHNQATTNATQSIPSSGSGSDNRSSNSSMTER